jgi:hypothetical protein
MGKQKCSYNWEPELVHPSKSLGNVTVYAKVEATKESTKATTVSITGEERGSGGWRMEGGGWREERRV